MAVTGNRRWRRISLKTLETDAEMAGPTSLTPGIATRVLFWPPGLAVTIARKTWRKVLKRLNPRPGLPSAPPPHAGFETRRDASLPGTRAERVCPRLRQASRARKIGRKALKRLNPRPQISGRRGRRSSQPPRFGVAGCTHLARAIWPLSARPKNRAQGLEKVESALGIGAAVAAASCGRLRDATRRVAPRHEGGKGPSAASAGDKRPENRAQSLEKVESAPGNLEPPREALLLLPLPRFGVAGCTHLARTICRSRLARKFGRKALKRLKSTPEVGAAVGAAAPSRRLRDATRRVAPGHDGGKGPSAASTGGARPENRPQSLEKVKSAPGRRRPAGGPPPVQRASAGRDGAAIRRRPTGGRAVRAACRARGLRRLDRAPAGRPAAAA